MALSQNQNNFRLWIVVINVLLRILRIDINREYIIVNCNTLCKIESRYIILKVVIVILCVILSVKIFKLASVIVVFSCKKKIAVFALTRSFHTTMFFKIVKIEVVPHLGCPITKKFIFPTILNSN